MPFGAVGSILRQKGVNLCQVVKIKMMDITVTVDGAYSAVLSNETYSIWINSDIDAPLQQEWLKNNLLGR